MMLFKYYEKMLSLQKFTQVVKFVEFGARNPTKLKLMPHCFLPFYSCNHFDSNKSELHQFFFSRYVVISGISETRDIPGVQCIQIIELSENKKKEIF